MKKIIITLLVLAACSGFVPALLAGEAELLATLKSATASRFDKSEACRQLAVVGTKASVPTLAALLTDPDLSHMARYALEPLNDPSVDDALRDALAKTTDRLRVGVIHSIGVRGDKKAVDALIKLLPEPAAAYALARINTPAAHKALVAGLPKTAPALIEAAGTKPEHFDSMAAASYPAAIRVAAMRGAIISRGANGVPLLVKQLSSDDPAMFGIALRITREWKESGATKALADALAKLPADRQAELARALGDRGDRAAVPALLALRSVASVQALTELADPAAVPTIAELATGAGEVATAAQAALAAFPGKAAEEAIVKLMENSDAKLRTLGLTLAAQRRMSSAAPALVKLTGDVDEKVRVSALRALNEIAGMPELPALINLLVSAKSPAEADAAEAALTSLCVRQSRPGSTTLSALSEALCGALAKSAVATKPALLRVLRTAGGAQALAAVRAASNDANAEVKETAQRALCNWATPDALPDVIALAKSAADKKWKILALQGELRLIPLQNAPEAQKLAMLKEASASVERTEEKRLLLSALGDIPSANSLAMVVPFLTAPGLKEEACVAAVTISEKIVEKNPSEVAAALSQVAPKNARLAKYAKDLLAQAKKASKK
jgi:HEAT repeat protein